jgi:hypothetical protein
MSKQKPLTDVEIFQLAAISEADIEKAVKSSHPTLAPFLKAEPKK